MKIQWNGMGLFKTDDEWIHPDKTEKTYELIYVINGTVKIRENSHMMTLKKGDLCILSPNTSHCGFEKSNNNPSFYWLHFFADSLDLPLPFVTSDFRLGYIFKELNHFRSLDYCPSYVMDSYTAYIISSLIMAQKQKSRNKLSDEIYEWTRINASAKLTVNSVAKHFGYNGEYISKLIKKNYGQSLKNIIDIFIINNAKELLCNTNLYISEIAQQLGFSGSTAFISFYKYHEKTTPTKYRDSYSKTHMNKK